MSEADRRGSKGVDGPSGRPESGSFSLDALLASRTPPAESSLDPGSGKLSAEGGLRVTDVTVEAGVDASSSVSDDMVDGVVGELREIDVDAVVANEFQPRRRFDDEALAALTASVRSLGVLQPILVRPDGEGLYELIAGERRWRAARQAGLATIPAVVRPTGDRDSLEQAIVENLHRADLTSIEEAHAYQQLVDEFGLTQDEVAGRVGKSRSAVSNTLRLLQLPAAVQRLVDDGSLSAGHARAVLSVSDAAGQLSLVTAILEGDLSVRAAEELARGVSGGARGSKASRRESGRAGVAAKSVGALEVENRLGELLATKVEVLEASGNGRLVIRFADDEDLGRISQLLLEALDRSQETEAE